MRKNRQGVIHFAVLGAIALILVVVGGGVLLSMRSSENTVELSVEEQEIYDQATDDLAEFITAVKIAKGEQNAPSPPDGQQKLDKFKIKVQQRADAILNKQHCDATIYDVENALQTAADAQQIGDLELSDKLFRWAKLAFRSIVPDLTLSYGWSYLEIGTDMFEVDMADRQPIFDAHEETFSNRSRLAQQATLLGFQDLADDILGGKHIQPACITLYDVSIDADFFYEDKYGSYHEDWTANTTTRDVPIYKADEDLGLMALHKSHSQEADITHQDIWWSDASYDAPYDCKLSKMKWKILLDYLSQKNLWDEKLIVEYNLTSTQEDPYISAYCEGDGGDTGISGDEIFRNGKIEVSMQKIWRMEVFEIKENLNSEEGAAKIILRFTPKRRISIEDFLNSNY